MAYILEKNQLLFLDFRNGINQFKNWKFLIYFFLFFCSFTDPNGNTVVVKYRAGRNGFEILNPEEVLPKAPQAYWFFTLNSRH